MRRFIVLVAFLAGCPGPDDTSDAAAALDAAAAPDASADADAPDTGVPADAGVDPGVDARSDVDGAAGRRGGLLSITQGSFGGTASHTAFGLFSDVPIETVRSGGLGAGCTLEAEVGACRRYACEPFELVSDDAGEIRIDVDGSSVFVLPARGATPGLYGDSATGTAFSPGERVSFEALGGLVPAFTAEVVAPGAPVITLPTTLSRTTDLVLDWSGSGGDTMQISFAALGGSVVCLVPGDTGTVTIDAGLLSSLATGSAASISASYFATTTVTSGSYTIDVSVAQGASGTATFE